MDIILSNDKVINVPADIFRDIRRLKSIGKVMLLLVLGIFCTAFGGSAVPFDEIHSSFSDAIKEGYCRANEEVILFKKDDGESSVITEQWFTGCFDDSTNVTFEIDDDKRLKIEVNLFMMLGDGVHFLSNISATAEKWMTRRAGMVAKNGGFYTTMKIPFRSIKISFKTSRSGYFWYIVRGLTGLPYYSVGDIELPNRARLKLYKTQKVLKAFDRVDLVQSSGNASKQGMVYMVSVAASSPSPYYLEACFEAYLDSQQHYLSSGTEDFFLSAYYFNTGLYAFDHAGLLRWNGSSFAAFKMFEDDPLIFKRSVRLIWGSGEDEHSRCYARNKNHPTPDPVSLVSYVWLYEWPL